jgi:hypothetical protein
MYVQIPTLNSECFKSELIYSLSKLFVEQQENNLRVLGLIVRALEENTDIDNAIVQIESHKGSAQYNLRKIIPEDKDPFDFSLSMLREMNEVQDVLNAFREAFPISRLIDSQGQTSIDLIEEYTELDFSELYPLYSKPSDEVISYFLQHVPAVAFFEIEDNYFMGLTTSGSSQSNKLALGYLMVDHYIPHNYIPKKKSQYFGLSDEQTIKINKYFDNEVQNAS